MDILSSEAASPSAPEHGPFPSDELLALYAVGTIDPALALVIETQAAISPSMRARVDDAMAVAAALFTESTGVAVGADALDRLFAQIDVDDAGKPAALDPAHDMDVPPELAFLPPGLLACARRTLAKRQFKTVLPGLKILELEIEAANENTPIIAELMRIEPGRGAPRHDHDGPELTLLLKGAFHDGHRRFGPGEVSIAGPGHVHRPVAEAGEICYALAVRDGPLRFTGALGLIQRALGF